MNKQWPTATNHREQACYTRSAAEHRTAPLTTWLPKQWKWLLKRLASPPPGNPVVNAATLISTASLCSQKEPSNPVRVVLIFASKKPSANVALATTAAVLNRLCGHAHGAEKKETGGERRSPCEGPARPRSQRRRRLAAGLGTWRPPRCEAKRAHSKQPVCSGAAATTMKHARMHACVRARACPHTWPCAGRGACACMRAWRHRIGTGARLVPVSAGGTAGGVRIRGYLYVTAHVCLLHVWLKFGSVQLTPKSFTSRFSPTASTVTRSLEKTPGLVPACAWVRG